MKMINKEVIMTLIALFLAIFPFSKKNEDLEYFEYFGFGFIVCNTIWVLFICR